MKVRFLLAMAMGILFASAVANAASTCSQLPFAVTDGRSIGPVTITNANDISIVFWVTGGHSYSLEVVSTDDNANQAGLSTPIVGTGYCPASNSVTLNDTTQIDPSLGAEGVGKRVSFTASSNGFLEGRVGVTNGSYPFMVKVADTTMYNPRWSTSGTWQTTWGFQNTTRSTIHGTLRVYDPNGALLTTVGPFAIAAHMTAFKVTGTDVIVPHTWGSAEFVHDGPPGAIQGDAYYYNGSYTLLVPSTFNSVRSGH